jgi:diguanylate cyclase (GGDEF)-like protein/PAS domain S-box-containing protein
MATLLLVEPSATRAHVLRRLLTADGYDIEWLRDYRAGAAALAAAGAVAYPAVLVGLPEAADADAEALLAALRVPPLATLPVLLLTTHAEPGFDWIAARNPAALLLWDDHSAVAECLARLLAAPADEAAATAPAGANADIRVLFVDDSRTVRSAFARLLQRHGYRVEVAADAAAAFTLATEHAFDIAIIDYFMPGENGDSLCRRLHADARCAGITSAILTGTYLDQVIRDSLKAGAVECMFKNEADELFLARLAAMSRSVRAAKSVETERQRLAGILGSVGDGVYGVNRRGQITFMNPAAHRILGIAEDEAVHGRAACRLFHYATHDGRPLAAEQCRLQHAYATGTELHAFETVFWHRNHAPVPVECTVVPLRIEGRFEGSVVAFRDVSERRAFEQKLSWQAQHDALTQLLNRQSFEQALADEVARLQRSDEVSALVYLDLDRFKYINDTAGHTAGDQLLIEISHQLQERLRGADLLARLGGDEFAMILRNVPGSELHEVAEGFRRVLEDYSFAHDGKGYKINGSLGVARLDRHTQTPGEALANADLACHIAKSKGRNLTHVYEASADHKVSMYQELGWSSRLQEALARDGFMLYYQPIVSLAGLPLTRLPADADEAQRQHWWRSQPVHYEVLLRLRDARGGVVQPNLFLPTAERFSLMPQIDLWVVRRAIERLASFERLGQPVSLAVNLSGHTLGDARLIPEIKHLLVKHDVAPSSLMFEITETSAIANLEAAKRLINELRDLGCQFALDDFGSGFSSFNHLKHLPVDVVKIDGQFVRGMADDPNDRAIVTSITDIAHSFGKRVIAEFVESRAILESLNDIGVDAVQGYYLSQPRAQIPLRGRSVGDAAGLKA